MVTLKRISRVVLLWGGLLPSLAWCEQRPNVLFIAVDDLRAELGCLGNQHVHSPNIDRLAARGTLFTRAYCQQTVCNPSRASLLTGMRPDSLRVWDLPTHFRQNQPQAITLPQRFKQEGYFTQGIGKIFHNWRQDDYQGDPVSWSVPQILHYNNHGSDLPLVEGELPADESTVEGVECRDVPDEAYFDGRVAKEAVAALRRLQAADSPFFLGVGFWKPHSPFNAPKQYWNLYDRQQIPLPSHLEPPRDVPQIALTDDRSDAKTKAGLRELHHGHLAAISYVDAQVGRVLAELEALGLSNNTIVVFWSDHGLHIGEHGLFRKTTLFELDAQVPLIIATPDHRPGQRCDALVELLDIYPTLLELCRLPADAALEGRSLVPLLDDPRRRLKAFALTQSPRPNYPRGEQPVVMGYSLRSERFRYTEWRKFESETVQARELYDHSRDALETENVVDQPQYAQQVAELAHQLQQVLTHHQPE